MYILKVCYLTKVLREVRKNEKRCEELETAETSR